MEIKIDNVNGVYYDNIEKALIREDFSLWHPRTRELIIGCTRDKRVKITRKHLNHFPRVAYHRKLNQPSAVIFKPSMNIRKHIESYVLGNPTVEPTKFTGKIIPTWKSVFYSKHQRRQ